MSNDGARGRLGLVAMLAGLGVLVFFWTRSRQAERPEAANSGAAQVQSTKASEGTGSAMADIAWRRRWGVRPEVTAEEYVTSRVADFGRSRRELARELAKRHGVEMTPEVESFFDAVESGDWELISKHFKALKSEDESKIPRSEPVQKVWPAIVDAFGAAEQAHLWPAEKLMEYGESILGSLRPGMVYIGGTDSGRWIPALLNGTGAEERHMVLTQNALADSSYLDYVNLQYGERLQTISPEDSGRAFGEYIEDAKRRYEHDRNFPGEPKQVAPGEEIQMEEGRVRVGGLQAVMAINERLLQTLLEKNPGVSFAMQESYPMRSLHEGAAPMGPIMELRAKDNGAGLTAEVAQQSVEYWRERARAIGSDPLATAAPETYKSYSHDIARSAELLQAHGFTAEAEEAYRLSHQVWAENPETALAHAELLKQMGQTDRAEAMLQDFRTRYPDQVRAVEKARGFWQEPR